MRKLVFAAALVAGLSMVDAGSAAAQGCGGVGGMCALPGAAGQQQAVQGMPMQQAAPGATTQGGMGMMGMCPCCRMMAMAQPQPGAQGGMGMMGQGGLRPMPSDGMGGMGGDMGMGSTPRPPAGGAPAPQGVPPAQQ